MVKLACSRCGESKDSSLFTKSRSVSSATTSRKRQCLDCKYASSKAAGARYEAKNNEARRERWSSDESYRAAGLERARRYKERNREKLAGRLRDRNLKRKKRVISIYGHACACCGENRFEFLCIDHVDDNGGVERSSLTAGGVYRKLDSAGVIIDGYQCLCHNCNMAKAFYGYSPANPSFFENQRRQRSFDAAGPALLADFIRR